MRRCGNILKASLLMTLLATINASGQSPTPTPKPPECSTPVYKSKEVDRRVKVVSHPSPKFDQRDIAKHPGSVIVLRAIFCASGKVTDIKVQKSVSRSLDEEAISTARTIKFWPAEKNGQPVSQWMTLQYHIDVF
ncbi:MAG TPA: TonB family protein [Pyrinomonadaceae bacterium]